MLDDLAKLLLLNLRRNETLDKLGVVPKFDKRSTKHFISFEVWRDQIRRRVEEIWPAAQVGNHGLQCSDSSLVGRYDRGDCVESVALEYVVRNYEG